MTVDLEPKMMIRDVHIADRPRERLIRQGAESLSNQELIAILLRTGTRKESVLVLANRILSSFDKIQDLKDATIEEFMTVKGVGEAKAVQLLAAAEIGKRLYQKTFGRTLHNPFTRRCGGLFNDGYVFTEPRTFRRFIFKCKK